MQTIHGVIITLTLWALPMAASAVELTISCGATPDEKKLCERSTRAWARQTGHAVAVVDAPEKTNDRYRQYLNMLSEQDSQIDVLQIDVIWPGLLADFLVDLREFVDPETIQQHHPSILANNTVAGRLVGMPWYTDVGLLYYRKDLLEKHEIRVPEDWSELADSALFIQTREREAGNGELWGYVFQGEAYEGLSCNALEWIDAYAGGTIVDGNGDITINNPAAVLATARAATWIGIISPPRVIAFKEEDARITFQLGNTVFMRNWPYAWALLNAPDSPVAGKIDIAPLPRGGARGKSSGVLGGWQLAASKFSEHPEIAADLVRYLTSAAVQKQRAITGSYAPTIMTLYEDAEVLKANPFFAKLGPVLEQAVARPSAHTGKKYMAVTTHFWEAIHDVLQGVESSADALAALQDQLRLIKGREGW